MRPRQKYNFYFFIFVFRFDRCGVIQELKVKNKLRKIDIRKENVHKDKRICISPPKTFIVVFWLVVGQAIWLSSILMMLLLLSAFIDFTKNTDLLLQKVDLNNNNKCFCFS